MKKTLKKLALSHETLRKLEEGGMREAVGASGGGLAGSYCLQCPTFYICTPTRDLKACGGEL